MNCGFENFDGRTDILVCLSVVPAITELIVNYKQDQTEMSDLLERVKFAGSDSVRNTFNVCCH